LKCKNSDQSNLNMYRGITLTPVISKLFKSVLLGLYSEYLITDPLQNCNTALRITVAAIMRYLHLSNPLNISPNVAAKFIVLFLMQAKPSIKF